MSRLSIHSSIVNDSFTESTQCLYTARNNPINFLFMNLKSRIEERLKALGKTKSWLAAELGTEKQNVNNWIRRGNIPTSWVFLVADLLECDAEWLMTGERLPESGGGASGVYSDPKIEAAQALMSQLDDELKEEALRHLRLLVRAKGK